MKIDPGVFLDGRIRALRRSGLVLILVAVYLRGAFAAAPAGMTTNYFSASAEDLANPERGFYLHTETRASAPTPVPSSLANLRVNGSRDPNNAYLARITLVLRVFYLDAFVTSPLSAAYLSQVQADFDSIRNQGAKVIVRFAYFQTPTRPFPEPSKARVLEHIHQLAPILHRHRDVIAVVQQGFIGAWGEGYYTDVFSTAGQAFTAQNWLDRAEVIQALLEAVPRERMIQVRVPQQRQKFLRGPQASVQTPPEAAVARGGGSAAARLGFHNDCFLADATDAGTFASYDGATDALVTSQLRLYQATETSYVVMGGETCAENSPADDCAGAGGRADSDLALFHYSFLNQMYNANVNDDWVPQGCLDTVTRRLGYRLALVSAVLPAAAAPGQIVSWQLTLTNSGYAAPFNPRGVEWVWREINSGATHFAELSRDLDARVWGPGSNVVIGGHVALPPDLPDGAYELFLHLPDPTPTLYGRTPYTVRLANAGLSNSLGAASGDPWDPSTGYHRLGAVTLVQGVPSGGDADPGAVPLLRYSAIRETYDTWRERHFPGGTPDGAPTADPDADGRTNWGEYGLGLNPTRADPSPELARVEDGRLVLSVRKPPGVKEVVYEVGGSTNLAAGIWDGALVRVLTNSSTELRARLEAPQGFLRLQMREASP